MTFELYEKLVASPIFRQGRGIRLYSASAAGINTEAVRYFAASIFWRCGATTWNAGKGVTHHIELGQYQESLRTYVLGKTDFPTGVTLMVQIAEVANARLTADYPSKAGIDRKAFDFQIPGIRFMLFIEAENTPVERLIDLANSPVKLIGVWADADEAMYQAHIDIVQSAPAKGSLAQKFRTLPTST